MEEQDNTVAQSQPISAPKRAAREAEEPAAWEPADAEPGCEVKLWAVLAYPGSRVSDIWIGGHKVQVPNDALKTSWAFANLHSPRILERALAEYDRAMRDEVIPAITEDERLRALMATRLRLGLPVESGADDDAAAPTSDSKHSEGGEPS